MGVLIGEGLEDRIYTLLFADDQVLITQEYEDMEFMVRTLLEEYCMPIGMSPTMQCPW